ncbi:MAG: hypothetical protein H7832_13005 [Magnetococcus sp. DMHC-6]
MMLWFTNFNAKKHLQGLREKALNIYNRLVERVLPLAQGGGLQIADEFELRFDLLVFFVAGIMFQLRQSDSELAETLWAVTFEGLDHSLRQRGVQDLGMRKKMRKIYADAAGRLQAYHQAMQQQDDLLLRRAVGRNVLNGAEAQDPRVGIILEHLQMVIDEFQGEDLKK